MLLYNGWHDDPQRRSAPDEPSHLMLFKTRKDARNWCRERRAGWRAYPDGDSVRGWRVAPVRVRVTTTYEHVR